METLNTIESVFIAFKSIMLFIRPAVVLLMVLCFVVDCLLFYGHYKYNIFPEKLAKKLDSYDVLNLKGVKKLGFEIGGRILVVSFLMYGMFSSWREAYVVFLGLGYCHYVMYFAYKVFRPYFAENKT